MLPYLSFCLGLEANDSRSNFLESSLEIPFFLVTMKRCTTPLGAGGERMEDSKDHLYPKMPWEKTFYPGDD